MMIQGSRKPRLRISPFLLRSLLVVAIFCAVAERGAPVSAAPEGEGLKPILDYISSGWDTLTRSMTECKSIVDPKVATAPVLYLPAGFVEPQTVKTLTADCKVRVEHL